MNISKHIQILVLVLFPACLMGMGHGCWTEQDKLGRNVLIEWRKITDYQKLLDAERELIPVMAAAFQHEVIMSKDPVENSILATTSLQQQNEAEMSKYLQRQKIKIFTSFVVIVKDVGSDKILGFAMFHSKPKFEKGCIQLEPLAVIPAAQGRGLSRKLVFSILKLMPGVNQIELFVRHENVKAQAVYKSMGFSVHEELKFGKRLKYVIKS
ncbi:MAG: GNAT family N-acetyltransferase [bacterium]